LIRRDEISFAMLCGLQSSRIWEISAAFLVWVGMLVMRPDG
jgi:hypothetical protein